MIYIVTSGIAGLMKMVLLEKPTDISLVLNTNIKKA